MFMDVFRLACSQVVANAGPQTSEGCVSPLERDAVKICERFTC
jgi:hypothetical protein